MPRTIAVIPAWNEAATIAAVVSDVRTFVDSVLVVDDGSTDATSTLAQEAGARIVRHRINRGYGAASVTGIAAALRMGAEYIVTIDADGQFLASDIPRLLQPLISGNADVVMGSRFGSGIVQNEAHGVTIQRRLRWLRLAALITRWYTGVAVTDPHNGFRACTRQAVEKFHFIQDQMSFSSEFIEQVAKHRIRFREVPITVRYTDYSLRKGQKLGNSFKIVWDLFISRLSK
jgi:glycosyltransferase involved in cell wall biosynthesis